MGSQKWNNTRLKKCFLRKNVRHLVESTPRGPFAFRLFIGKVANEVDGVCIQAFSKLSDYHQLKKYSLSP